MKNIFIYIFLVIILLSCNSYSDNNNKPVSTTSISKKASQIYDQLTFKEVASKCNRLLITHYDNFIPYNNSYLTYAPFSTEKIYESKAPEVIDEFNNLLSKSEKTGYCCCPERNLTLSFYDKTDNFENYYIDTISDKKSIRIYQRSFQFSYIIDKVDWSKFLNEFNLISIKEFATSDLNKARDIYNYSISNNLPVINNRRTSKKWMYYDGEFNIKVSTVGERIEKEEIFENIRSHYPLDTFELESISESRLCGSSIKNDCIQEYIIRVYSNKPFFDKFDIYSPKSFFDGVYPEFCVLGNKKDLSVLDSLYK